ncbi:MAG: hypothetical protein HC785_27915 [Calothrix sp. CSU_2_0]|nr:hypothetical protein [Calothrix sp. CSU_2_0]
MSKNWCDMSLVSLVMTSADISHLAFSVDDFSLNKITLLLGGKNRHFE